PTGGGHVLSIQTIRERTDAVRQMLADRATTAPLDEILAADETRRTTLVQVEQMRKGRNDASKAIGTAKDNEARQRLIEEQRAVSGRLDELEAALRHVDAELDALLLQVPNIPHEDVPIGGEDDSVVVLEGDGAAGTEHRYETPIARSAHPAPAQESGRKPHWE